MDGKPLGFRCRGSGKNLVCGFFRDEKRMGFSQKNFLAADGKGCASFEHEDKLVLALCKDGAPKGLRTDDFLYFDRGIAKESFECFSLFHSDLKLYFNGILGCRLFPKVEEFHFRKLEKVCDDIVRERINGNV